MVVVLALDKWGARWLSDTLILYYQTSSGLTLSLISFFRFLLSQKDMFYNRTQGIRIYIQFSVKSTSSSAMKYSEAAAGFILISVLRGVAQRDKSHTSRATTDDHLLPSLPC